jgi:hypothetical protein
VVIKKLSETMNIYILYNIIIQWCRSSFK